jgi:hypothetical protein
MRSILLIVIAIVFAASMATYARYESFDPCDWLQHDLARQSGLPLVVVQAQIRASFLLRGITQPGAYDCLDAWWTLRREGRLPLRSDD